MQAGKYKDLDALFANQHFDCDPWIIGKIPKHYKRMTCSRQEAVRLAKLGASRMAAAYGARMFFTQSVIIGAVLDDGYDEVVVVSPSQYGKAIDDDEPVLTRDGWKRHGDLQVGDEVISMDGEFVKVLHVHPKCEMDRIVVFENGDEVICHHNHEWIYKGCNTRNHTRPRRTASVAEMEERGVKMTDGHSRFTVPEKTAIRGEEKELNVPPYVMGVWLGDGSTTKGQICACPADRKTLDECRKFYPEGREWVHKDTGVITAGFNGLKTDLGWYGLATDNPTEKYIPAEYLTASIEQRLELLAGLIDTDGYNYTDTRWGKKSRMTFTTAGRKLKDSFEALVSTFGWKCSVVEVEPFTSSSGIVGKKPYWMISFSPTFDIPCRLERKRPQGFSKQKGLGIKEIRHTNGIQGNCITVEGGTYLVGKHLIPTHNSYIMGHVALLRAYDGAKQYIAAGSADKTQIIMSYTTASTQEAAPEIKKALLMKPTELERLTTSVSKQKLAFANGGFVEPITLADAYNDNIAQNKAVGRGGDFIVDEAALLSDNTFAEMGRREFARIDGKKFKSVLISNPHRPGVFYDKLTQEDPPERTLIIWMDALTAVEEERFDKNTVYESEFARNKSTRRRYLLCILDADGGGMFDTPKICTEEEAEGDYTQYFLGVDAAYKGKDNIEVAVTAVGGGKIRPVHLHKIKKPQWIDGVTSKDIIKEIARIAYSYSAAMICVDVGWGVWLVEGLAGMGLNVRGVNFSETPTRARVKANHYAAKEASNKRAEMHLDFQSLIEDQALEVTQEVYDGIKATLPYVNSERKASGKIQICPKEQIKAVIGHSPDELDAVLLSVHASILFLGDTAYAIP